MRKFEGNINGKIYTDEKEFDKAVLSLYKMRDNTSNVYVSYKYTNVPDDNDKNESNERDEVTSTYVSEKQYVKNINSKKDVDIDADMTNKLKNASNKSEIKNNIKMRIASFDDKISENLLRIHDLKLDYLKLDEKIKCIDNQIRTLNAANNNYQLNIDYYKNIKNILESEDNKLEEKEECKCDCECKGDECKCKDNDVTKDIVKKPYDIPNYLIENNIHTLSDLIDWFLTK